MSSPGVTVRVMSQVARLLSVVGVGLYLALFLYNSVTRTRQFSPDSMNYVDVARNIATGRGIVQSTLGYNQIYLFSPDSTIPIAFTAQPPVYPLLIALVSRGGLTYADAALVVPVIAYAVILLLAYYMARELYDEHTALLAVGCLLIYAPLSAIARFAWSESVSVVFLLFSLWLLVRFHAARMVDHARILAFGAGLAAGLAFSTRYALVPILALGLLFFVLELHNKKAGLEHLPFYLLGFALPTGLVLWHNIINTGAVLPPAFPSDRDLLSNLSDAIWTIFGDYSPIGSSEAQAGAAGLILMALALALAAQRRLYDLPHMFFKNGRYLLLLWSVGYLIFIVGLRTISYFSPIDDRIIIPGSVTLVILFAAFCVSVTKSAFRTWRREQAALSEDGFGTVGDPTSKVRHRPYLSVTLLYAGVAGLALMLCTGEIALAQSLPVYNLAQIIAGSDRLSWISRQTTDQDLIIGDDTMDVPFYLGREEAVSFSPYPHTVFFTYPTLSQFADDNCARFRNLYLVLRSYNEWTYKDQLHLFGRFIADLHFGHLGNYPRVKRVTQLSDAIVFQVICRQSGP